ncbi:hypothetical protein JW960_02935 [candidate division KSB1 bacterium]|nr:hypothetical protein [candidate division KSB1 bacterium]
MRQRERDKGQDAKLSLLISTIKNRTEDESEFFNQQRLIAYPLIRSVAQQARDEAKKITAERVIQDYKLWTQELCERYNRVLDTFYDNISLLEHFNHYHYVHTFKNELLSFYLKTIELNPKKKKNLEILKTELVKLLDSYQQIVKNIRQLDEPESITKSDESN